MLIRILGFLVGALVLWLTFGTDAVGKEDGLGAVLVVCMGILFLLYGIGGQKLVEKIYPVLKEGNH